MFTGIIEEVGTITAVTGNTLKIEHSLKGINTGDSIAVNGICLTAAETASDGRLSFDFSPETREKTNLKHAAIGTKVNLERALLAGGRIGGHFLSGHVEATGKVIEITPAETAYIIKFSLPENIKRYAVYKGSIGVDGISLTISEISSGFFNCAIIPHTFNNTNLKFKKKNDAVNIEPDMLAKYVENLLNYQKKGVTEELLKENGYY